MALSINARLAKLEAAKEAKQEAEPKDCSNWIRQMECSADENQKSYYQTLLQLWDKAGITPKTHADIAVLRTICVCGIKPVDIEEPNREDREEEVISRWQFILGLAEDSSLYQRQDENGVWGPWLTRDLMHSDG